MTEGNNSTYVLMRDTHHLNFRSGSDFLFPPVLPPRPGALPRLLTFLKGTNPFGLAATGVLSASCDDPGTGAMRGKRYFGTFLRCGWIRV